MDLRYSYGPTNTYKRNELTPITRVIYHEIMPFMIVKGHNCRDLTVPNIGIYLSEIQISQVKMTEKMRDLTIRFIQLNMGIEWDINNEDMMKYQREPTTNPVSGWLRMGFTPQLWPLLYNKESDDQTWNLTLCRNWRIARATVCKNPIVTDYRHSFVSACWRETILTSSFWSGNFRKFATLPCRVVLLFIENDWLLCPMGPGLKQPWFGGH